MRLLDKLIERRVLLGKFVIVGASGVLVNQGTLLLLHALMHWPLWLAGGVAIELSILSNFVLNNFWTWQKGTDEGLWVRLWQYHVVACLSGSINFGVLMGLTSMGLHYLLSNFAGIGFAMGVNFIANHKWTFRTRTS